ncbi:MULTISPECIES: hypothetical protein [Mesorhizobium]|nr:MULTISPECIES: hypothetical protein [Mesorhizobium]
MPNVEHRSDKGFNNRRRILTDPKTGTNATGFWQVGSLQHFVSIFSGVRNQAAQDRHPS